MSYWNQGDSQYFNPGYIGHFLYYSAADTSVSHDQTWTAVPSTETVAAYSELKKLYRAYEEKVNTFNGLKETYNSERAKENARKADFFKNYFESPIAVPMRPCPPSQPMEWWGMKVDLSGVFDFYKITATQKKQKKAGLQPHYITYDNYSNQNQVAATIFDFTETSSKQDATQAVAYGFQIHSEGITDDYKLAGKTFGRLGSGTANWPENTTAFRYDTL